MEDSTFICQIVQKLIHTPEYQTLVSRLALDQLPDDLKDLNLSGKYLTEDDLVLINIYIGQRGWYLERLDLSCNQLKTFYDMAHLPVLKILDLRRNKIKEISPLDSLPELRCLNLEENCLSEIPDFDLPILEILYVSSNQMEKLPVMFGSKMPKLKFLNLSRNRLSTLSLAELTNLVNLDVSYNQLDTVPCLNLPRLTDFNLSYNRLTEPPDVFNLPKLKDLQLLGNQLQEFPTYPPGVNFICDLSNQVLPSV